MRSRPFLAALTACVLTGSLASSGDAQTAAPIPFGETFVLESRVLGEARRINVLLPPSFVASRDSALPVLYMPDGGVQEDFLHIAGLVQILSMNGSMRPFILVGIENTERRRDLTGPSDVPDDLKIAPRIGGSAAFRRFIRDELIPEIGRRYRTTDERAIVGESLAGLFVVETLFEDPTLFDAYIAIDPSLWWNRSALVERSATRMGAVRGRRVYLASSSQREIAALTERLAGIASEAGAAAWHHEAMPEETHATIFHPAALRAFRAMFAPRPTGQEH